MTQLEHCTNLLVHAVVGIATAGGLFALLSFGVMAYHLYPWTKK